MSITDHVQWPTLRPNFRLELYGRDGGPDHPRARIEVTPITLSMQALLDVRMPCVACGLLIHPIRNRAGRGNSRGVSGHLYFAATCALDQNIKCSRSEAARREYLAVRAQLEKTPAPVTERLF